MNQAPVPIVAKLNYSAEQAAELGAPHSNVKELRPLLRQFHDELMADLAPRLAEMRTEGLLFDYASSWLLGEFVAHAAAARVADALARLSACPELSQVERPTAKLHKTRRQR